MKFRLIGSFINATLVLIPLIVTFFYLESSLPMWARLFFVSIYGLITFGTITAWWVPYFGGRYLVHGNKAGFEEYQDTHSFLPPKGLSLNILLHFQEKDEILSNRDDNLYIERLRTTQPNIMVIIENDGGHMVIHSSLWQSYLEKINQLDQGKEKSS